MQIAHNPETGEYLGLQGGQWQKLQIAANDKGDKLYLGPDGWLPLDTVAAASPDKPAQERSVGRSLGLGTRNVLEGLGGMAGAVVNPFANLVDYATGGTGTRFQNQGKALADYFGLATPQTTGERVAGAAIEGAAGALPTLGAGLAMQAAGKAPAIAEALTTMPRLQAVSGLTGGAAMGGAQEGGAGPVGQIAAGLAGGIAPGMAGVAGSTFGRGFRSTAGALDRLTAGGQERLAGTALERFASDPVRARQLAQEGGGVLVEGSQPTLAQLTGDPRLAVFEKAMQSTPQGAEIQGRYISQQEAQREALNALLDPVKARQQAAIAEVPEKLRAAAPYGANLDERTAGQMIRGAFEDEYGAMRQQVRQAYESIDPEGTASFDLRPIVEGFEQSLGGGRYQRVPSEIQSVLNQMKEDIAGGVNVTYRDLQDVRTMLSDMSQSAAVTGNAPVRRMAGMMKQQIDDYIERAAMSPELMGGAPTPQAGSAAYRQGTAGVREAMQSDEWFQDLDYLMQSGLNRDAVERVIGKAGAEELNNFSGGVLVRKGGKLMPDTAAAELKSFQGLISQTGGGSYHADADAFLQSLMQRLGGMYGRKNQALGNIRQEIMQEGVRPHTGFTPEQAAAFQEAKALRGMQGERFEQGANLPLTRRGASLEGQAIPESNIPSKYFSAGPTGSEAMEAFQRSVGGQETARSAIADYAISTALQKSTLPDGTLDPRRLQAFMESYSPALSQMDNVAVENSLQQAIEAQTANIAAREGLASIAKPDVAGNWKLQKAQRQFPEIPQSIGLSPEETTRLSAVQKDLQRALETTNRSGVPGSPTAQLQRAMSDLADMRLGVGGGGGITRNMINRALSTVTKGADENIERMLVNSVLDPEYAAKLMANTNTMQGTGVLDAARRWAGSGGSIKNKTVEDMLSANKWMSRREAERLVLGGETDSFSNMLKRYGIATKISAGRLPAQTKEGR